MEYILKLYHISKNYGQNKVLNDISFNIKKGEIYGLVGKNGSGKSTLLRVITGLAIRYKGSFQLFNKEKKETGRLAGIVDAPSLFYNLSAKDNLRIQCELLAIKDHSVVGKILEIVGLENSNKTPVNNYSLGMKQRLAIGIALVGEPDFLILDEPVNGLDPEGIADLRTLILHLNQELGITILIASHILSELSRLATCYGILNNGTMIKEITMKELEALDVKFEDYYLDLMRRDKIC